VPRRILVINVSRIGDTLLATPAIRALASAYPGATISVLAHPKRAEVLQHLPFVASVGAISKGRARLRGWLPGARFDLAIVYGFDRPLVAYALRVADKVVAFSQGDEALDARLHRAVEQPEFQSEHSVRLALRLTDSIGVAHAGYRLAYRVTDAEREWACRRIEPLRAASAGPLIGMQVASFPTKAYRDWPAEHFAQLARRVRKDHPRTQFLLFGGREERARTQWLAREITGACTNFAGALRLRETAALMSCVDAYLGVDTGPTHIMGCFDIPLVGLYHCYSPSRIYGALDHPCFYPVDHPKPYRCPPETPMAEISVDTVLEALESALQARASS